jgi:hypothetical protein
MLAIRAYLLVGFQVNAEATPDSSPGPRDATLLRVRRDLGCDPGYFFTWPHSQCWGACLLRTDAGDTIRIWIVDVRPTRLFIEAATKERHAVKKEPVASAELKKVEQEITRIIGSIRFHSTRSAAASGRAVGSTG